MNTPQELLIEAVAAAGAEHSGSVDGPVGWFGIAEVEDDLTDLKIEMGLEADVPHGTYMVTRNGDGTVYVMPAEPEICRRWFAAMDVAHRASDPDEPTATAHDWLIHDDSLLRAARRATGPGGLRARTGMDLAAMGLPVDQVDWDVLWNLVRS